MARLGAKALALAPTWLEPTRRPFWRKHHSNATIAYNCWKLHALHKQTFPDLVFFLTGKKPRRLLEPLRSAREVAQENWWPISHKQQRLFGCLVISTSRSVTQIWTRVPFHPFLQFSVSCRDQELAATSPTCKAGHVMPETPKLWKAPRLCDETFEDACDGVSGAVHPSRGSIWTSRSRIDKSSHPCIDSSCKKK